MPQIEGGPKALNSRLEEVYSACKKGGSSESTCSAVAWKQVKKEGWVKAGGQWKKVTRGSRRG